MDGDIYICARVSDPKARPLPGSFISACEICGQPVWVGPGAPRVARRQCIQCTPTDALRTAGMREDAREVVAEALGLTDDEIDEAMKAMVEEFAQKREGTRHPDGTRH